MAHSDEGVIVIVVIGVIDVIADIALAKSWTKGEDGTERQRSVAVWHAINTEAISTGISLISSRLDGYPETGIRISTRFLTTLLGTREERVKGTHTIPYAGTNSMPVHIFPRGG